MTHRRRKRKQRKAAEAVASGEEPPDPVTLTVLAVGGVLLGAAGTTFGAISASQQAKSSAALANANAAAAERDATWAKEQARYNEDLARVHARKVRGSQRAGIGASGLDFSGSPLDLLEETAVQSEIEALAIRRQGEFATGSSQFSAAGSRLQANAYSKQAGTALTTGLISAGSQLASGIGGAAYNYRQMVPSTPPAGRRIY